MSEDHKTVPGSSDELNSVVGVGFEKIQEGLTGLRSALEKQDATLREHVEELRSLATARDKVPPPDLATHIWIGVALGCFGLLLGMLTTLSVAAGATALLIGLLGSLVGSSLLVWFQPDKLPEHRLTTLASGVLGLSVGCIFGLIVSFAMKYYDPGRDMDSSRSVGKAVTAESIAHSQAVEAREQFRQTVYERANAILTDDKLPIDERLKQCNVLLTVSSSIGTESPRSSEPAKDGNVFRLNSAARSALAAEITNLKEKVELLQDEQVRNDLMSIVRKFEEINREIVESGSK